MARRQMSFWGFVEQKISGRNWRGWRVFLLFASVAIGGLFAYLIFWGLEGFIGDGQSARARFVVSASLLLLPLPTLFFLWFFRTSDTRDNINSGALSANLSLLFSDDMQSRCVALALLADMHRRNVFVEQIRLATHSINMQGERSVANLRQIDLSKMPLSGANFAKADLSEANLTKADLSGANLSVSNLALANLRESDLTDANLKNADLAVADFAGANLCGANLEDAQGLQSANMKGAIYNDDTKFPDYFNPDDCGMKKGGA